MFSTPQMCPFHVYCKKKWLILLCAISYISHTRYSSVKLLCAGISKKFRILRHWNGFIVDLFRIIKCSYKLISRQFEPFCWVNLRIIHNSCQPLFVHVPKQVFDTLTPKLIFYFFFFPALYTSQCGPPTSLVTFITFFSTPLTNEGLLFMDAPFGYRLRKAELDNVSITKWAPSNFRFIIRIKTI